MVVIGGKDFCNSFKLPPPISFGGRCMRKTSLCLCELIYNWPGRCCTKAGVEQYDKLKIFWLQLLLYNTIPLFSSHPSSEETRDLWELLHFMKLAVMKLLVTPHCCFSEWLLHLVCVIFRKVCKEDVGAQLLHEAADAGENITAEFSWVPQGNTALTCCFLWYFRQHIGTFIWESVFWGEGCVSSGLTDSCCLYDYIWDIHMALLTELNPRI